MAISRPLRYDVHQLCMYDDEDFVRFAYRAILLRDPDDGGLDHYLRCLRGGATKTNILWQIKSSKEGASRGVHIPGLKAAARIDQIFRLPIVGGLATSLMAIFTARLILQDLRVLENRLARVEKLLRASQSSDQRPT